MTTRRDDWSEPLASLPALSFIGRAQELATLGAALDAAARGHGGMHAIGGEGGVGKTRLAGAVADLAAARGFARVTGRAYPVETGIPYALFGDAFVPMLRALPPSMLQVLARGATAELGVLFPALRGDGVAAKAGTDESELKPRLLDSFARLLHRLAAREPLLVILENLQWADPSSLDLLHFLSRGAAEHPLVLLCTWNEAQRDANVALCTTEESLRSIGALTAHHLNPLTRAETSELICRQFDVPAAVVTDFVALLHDRTRGNPFFIEETLKSLVGSGRVRREDGRWTGWGTERLELPRTIRDALAVRIGRLSADARRLATIAAVVGAQVPHALFDTMAGLDATALLEAIDELRHERMLTESTAAGELAYEFTHPLLQEVLYAELSRARARALHGEIAEALEQLFGDRALAQADALAVHFLRAESPALAARACRYVAAAGASALERGANSEAAETLAAALAIADHDPLADAGTRESLLDLLARARHRLGDYAAATSLWERAVALADARGDVAAVAGLRRRLGVAAFRGARYDESLAHYDAGLVAAIASGDERAEASLRLARGATRLGVGQARDAESDMRASLAIAERTGDPHLLARAHESLQSLAIWRGPSAAAREHGERALAFARAGHDRGAEWTARWSMAMHAGLTGDAAGTAAQLAAASELAEELRSPVMRLWTADVGIEYRSFIGEWDEALVLAERTIADARAFGQQTLLPRLLVSAALVHLGRGDFARAQPLIEEAWTLSGADLAGDAGLVNVHAVVPAHVGRASWHLARGEHQQALAVGEAGLAIADRTGYVALAMHRLIPIIAESALFLQDWERAARYGRRLRETAEQLEHPLGLAWADTCDALTSLLQGDTAGALAMLQRAVDALEAVPYVEHAALLRRQLAIAHQQSGDIDAAVRELRRVHDIFARLGARPALADVRERLRSLGARPPARTPAAGIGVGALTAREAEIARLVAARKSNKEIGTALDISPRTVGTHLSNIFIKLDVDSRGALTDLVRSGALGGPP